MSLRARHPSGEVVVRWIDVVGSWRRDTPGPSHEEHVMADHRDTPADETRTTADPVHRDEAVYTEDRRDVVGREREEHGGVKIGSAFFGWLTATGMAVLLTALAGRRRRGASEWPPATRRPPRPPTPSGHRRDRRPASAASSLLAILFVVLLLRRLRRGPDGPLQRHQAGPRGVGVGARDRRRRRPSLGSSPATSTTSSRARRLPADPGGRGRPDHRRHHRRWCWSWWSPWSARCSAGSPACGSTARSTAPGWAADARPASGGGRAPALS